MQVTQSQLWRFSVVGKIHRNIDLIRNNITGQLMVRRISAPEDFFVLKALCGICHPNLMAVYSTRIMDGVCVSLSLLWSSTTAPIRSNPQKIFSVRFATD